VQSLKDQTMKDLQEMENVTDLLQLKKKTGRDKNVRDVLQPKEKKGTEKEKR